MNPQPLAGRRILVTRAANQAGKLSEGLRVVGATPVEVPVIEIVPPESYDALDAALTRIDIYDWLLFTSVNAVAAVHVRAMDRGVPLSDLRTRIAAVGRSTAEALEKIVHLEVSLTPREYVAESLVAELAPEIGGKRVLLARAASARDVVPNALRECGAVVDVVDAYRNALPEAASGQLRQALTQPIDAATFTSSSSASHLAEAAIRAGIVWPFAAVPAISIGPITSETLRELGWPPAAEANPHDIPGLIAAVVRALC